jgi:predicted alpha/beta-fold hydrolase
LRRQRIELPDGDFVDIDWTALPGAARVLVLHGLEGSLHSHYSGALLTGLARHGYRAGLLYFRGCSGEPNRLARSYHSGDSAGLDYVIRSLTAEPAGPLLAIIGISLGGNVLLKWLGEHGREVPLRTAIAVSVPFDLDSSARQLDRGMARLYRNHLLARLKATARRKAQHHAFPVTPRQLDVLTTFRAFDHAVTAPLHGFRDVDDYYTRSSCRHYLPAVQLPTLILHARNDPFLPATAIPAAADLGSGVVLELSADGGHVGFVTGPRPGRPHYWLEQRILRHLAPFTTTAR